MELWFDFHQKIGFHLSTKDQQAAEFFQAEYAFHQCQNLPPERPRVDLTLNPACFPSDLEIQTTHHKFLARWKYAIRFNGKTRVEIFAQGNSWAVPMIHHMLVHPSLRWLSAQNGELMLHAGAVSYVGHSLILTGQGGAGKTTTTSMLLAGGRPEWALHADDYVFLGDGPLSYAYLTRSHLYRDLLKWAPEIEERLTFYERLRLEILGWIRAWSDERLKWPVRLPASRLWPARHVENSASPAGMVFLRKGDVRQAEINGFIDPLGLKDELLTMNFFEARHFIRLVEAQQPVGWLDEWREREAALMVSYLSQIPVYQLTLPRHVVSPEKMRATLVENLESLVSKA